MNIPSYYISVGSSHLQGIDTSCINGLFISGLLYYVITRNLNRSAEDATIDCSDQLVASGEEVR